MGSSTGAGGLASWASILSRRPLYLRCSTWLIIGPETPSFLATWFCELSAHSSAIDEIRPAISLHPFFTGNRLQELSIPWAAEIAALVDEHGRGSRRLAIDTLSLDGIRALEALGIELVSGHALMEDARLVKGAEEITAMRCAVDACQRNIDDMRAIFEPGVSEVALWARLQESNFQRFGEWIETRLLSSGARTNPWYQEASSKRVAAGELMAFDTDLIGPYGMCVDMSRTWLCGGGCPSAAQPIIKGLLAMCWRLPVPRARPGQRF